MMHGRVQGERRLSMLGSELKEAREVRPVVIYRANENPIWSWRFLPGTIGGIGFSSHGALLVWILG